MSRLFTLYRETLQWNAAGLGVTQGAVFAQATGLPFDDRQSQAASNGVSKEVPPIRAVLVNAKPQAHVADESGVVSENERLLRYKVADLQAMGKS